MNLLQNVVMPSLSSSTAIDTQRTTVQLIAAIARFSPQIVAPAMSDLVPGILKGASQDDDELRESCLQVCVSIQISNLLYVEDTVGAGSSHLEVSCRNHTLLEPDHKHRSDLNQA